MAYCEREIGACMAKWTNAQEFKREFRKLLGLNPLTVEEGGKMTWDKKACAIDPADMSLQEIAYATLGAGYNDTMGQQGWLQQWQHARRGYIEQAGGAGMTPSIMAQVSGFDAAQSGLLEMWALDAFNKSEFLGDTFFTTRQRVIRGGRMGGVRVKPGFKLRTLDDNEPAPPLLGAPTYVEIPRPLRRAGEIKISRDVYREDLTGQVEQLVKDSAWLIRYQKDICQGDCVLGITNPLSREGVATNTYQTSATTTLSELLSKPGDYINSKATLPLTSYEDWNTAKILLGQNFDPITGAPIALPAGETVLMTTPHKFVNAQVIIHASQVWRRTPDPSASPSLYATEQHTAINPAAADVGKIVEMPWSWYWRLVGKERIVEKIAGYTALTDDADHAQSTWYYGRPRFVYVEKVPFQLVAGIMDNQMLSTDYASYYYMTEFGNAMVEQAQSFGKFYKTAG